VPTRGPHEGQVSHSFIHWFVLLQYRVSDPILRTLQLALVQRKPDAVLIVQCVGTSDCGGTYVSAEHRALLMQHCLVGSIGRNGWHDGVLCSVNESSR
jgi:hypothetical protein